MEKKFVCVNDVDFSEVPLFPVRGGYTVFQNYSWKRGIVFRFPKGIPARGRAVYVVFKEDLRIDYSAPRGENPGDGYIRSINPFVFVKYGSVERPYGKRTVVSVYDLGDPYPGAVLPRLTLATYSVRETSLGGRSFACLDGEILFQAVGGSDSATGNHGSRHVVLVARGPVTKSVHTVSNSGIRRSYEEEV